MRDGPQGRVWNRHWPAAPCCTLPRRTARSRSHGFSSHAARTSTRAASAPGAAHHLHAAAASGHHEMVEILVAAGANPAATDGQFGVTADEWARFFGHVELAERLKDLKTRIV